MLNLLFISDSPKAEYIKSVLQPVLKVIIDVETDFDQGLKNVFEKRPSTVCIQDQIGGVTGESVAHHIQMLLGNSAPTFILLHTGNDTAKAINGLYEHLIDLSRSDDVVAEDVMNTLKLLLGDQWGKIYIPPKSAQVSVELPAAVTNEPQKEADDLDDSFLFAPDSPEDAIRTAESDRAKAIDDDLAELLQMEVDKVRRNESSVEASSTVGAKSEEAVIAKPAYVMAEVKQTSPVISRPLSVVASSTPAAAEFRIGQNDNQAEEHIPEELLQAFEENYRLESSLLRRTIIIAFVCAVCAAGGWYLVRQNPQMVNSLTQRFLLSSVLKQSPVKAPDVVAVPPVQKPVTSPASLPAVKPLLPAFIPKDGHDSIYAVKNPGWERYVGEHNEYRVFSASGRILAVQVLAINDATISETMIKSVLQELVGSPDYQITSRNAKAHVRVENGTIQNKGEVKIYRKNGAVKAFVVSVN